jgi:hypothetical protein
VLSPDEVAAKFEEGSTIMTKDELSLLRSYASGPKIWDAVTLLPTVYALADQGLIEPVGDSGAYQLTMAGREALREGQ